MKKIIAVIFAIAIALSISVYGFAAPGEINYENAVTISHEPVIVVNPLYEDIVSEEDIEIDFNKGKPQVSASAYEYSGTYEGAGDQARDYLESRTAEFTVRYKTTNYDGSDERVLEIAGGILNEAMAHTGEPTEGDYINWHWEGYGVWISGSYSGGVFYLDITFFFTYYTTAEQEATVGAKINEIFEELDIESKNDYFKIKAIYDYICANVTYDWDNLNNDDYKLQYTAYAALINGTSVCQGYANLFYRMALLAGVDARLIAGIGAGGPHGWNIVQMGDYYYNLDSTWDAGVNPEYYECFLKCPATFVDHYRYVEYETAEFHAAYPMGTSDYVYNESDFEDENIIASGYCGGEGNGQNLEWKLDKDGVLTISGTGKMADYSSVYIWPDYVTSAPWGEYTDKLKTLVIEEGVTSIGKKAFYNLSEFSNELIIPDTVTEIRELAFSYCRGFKGDLVIPDGVEVIGRAAFLESEFKGKLVLSDSVKEIGEAAFAYCDSFSGSLELNDGLEILGKDAFYQCSFTGDLVIPGNLSVIGASAFAYCRDIDGSLIIEDGVRIIGENAFEHCDGIKGDLVIPESVTTIGNTAFRTCTGFDGKLVIGNKVETIGDGAFIDCNGFKGDILIPESVKSIGESAFQNCSGFDGKLILTNNINEIGKEAFRNCSGLTGELAIPESLAEINNYIFSDCGGFTGNLVIPENVTRIGNSAFLNCQGFTGNLVIPENVTQIGYSAFQNCSGLDGELVLNEKVKIISSSAFHNTGFTGKLVLPAGIEIIESDAFNHCDGFTGDLIIPDSVIRIESRAFQNCSGFTGDLILSKTMTRIGIECFSGCSGFKGELVIPEGITFIENAAFKNCSEFSGKIIFSNNIEEICPEAFLNCGINNYYFEGNAPSLGEKAFDSASDTIYYPRGAENWNIVAGKWNGYKAVEYRISLDINSDASVDIKDVYYLRLVAGKLIVPTAEDIELADVDGDGKLTAIDANILRKYLAGIIKELPAA